MECTYPITSTRRVDMIITESVFEVVEGELKCIELMPGMYDRRSKRKN
jgi:acyl CoA:acetate/3-ketoacid CoA transferase beta subunit